MFHFGYFNAILRFKVTIFALCDHRSNNFS